MELYGRTWKKCTDFRNGGVDCCWKLLDLDEYELWQDTHYGRLFLIDKDENIYVTEY